MVNQEGLMLSKFQHDYKHIISNLFFLLKRYIHDEMYGVKLDPAGNYLLMGGSGDEYSYSEINSTTGAQSDVWVSYLVVLDPQVSINS